MAAGGKGEIVLNGTVAPGRSFEIEGERLENLMLWSPRPGEAVTVSDREGRLFRARITALTGEGSTLHVFEDTGFTRANEVRITLLQALPDRERMELVVQKTTELGADCIVPFKSERSISLEERESRQKKAHRWGSVALKAAKQSRRATLPELLPYRSFADALSAAAESELRLMLVEGPGSRALKDVLHESRARSVALLVGPEGGFTADEVEEASKAGFIPVTLGQRILRTETASIVGVGIVAYELGG